MVNVFFYLIPTSSWIDIIDIAFGLVWFIKVALLYVGIGIGIDRSICAFGGWGGVWEIGDGENDLIRLG